MQLSPAVPISFSAVMGGVLHEDGSVMGVMTVGMAPTSCRQPAVCFLDLKTAQHRQ